MALLRMPEPYDFELSTERYRAFGPDLANLWHDDALHRVVDGREVRIGPAEGGADVEPLDATTEPVVRKLLGAEFDLDAFYGFATGDPTLAELVVELRGLRPPIAVEPFESLVTSITAQQVSLRAAFAIRNRLIERFGVRAEHAYAFPTRERMAGAEPEELTALGFSGRKAEETSPASRRSSTLYFLPARTDRQRVSGKCRLALPGIGEWTADWFLARHLARPRAWPAGDLAVRKAVSRFYGEGGIFRSTTCAPSASGSRPFENLSAHYLLASLMRGT